MAFTSLNGQVSMSPVGAGEARSGGIVYSTSDYDSGIVTGRFASLNAGTLATGVTGTLAGVVVRDLADSIETTVTQGVDDAVTTVQHMRSGHITVDVETGDTPAMFGSVYTQADGKATTDAAETATNAEFIMEVQTDVWLIRLI